MGEAHQQMKQERERRLAALDSMLEFVEGWVERELCAEFRTIAECLYSDTLEHRLACVLLGANEPLTLSQIAVRCGVSRDLVLRNGRIRRAIERPERREIVVNTGREGRPNYSLDRRNLTTELMGKVYLKAVGSKDGIASATLRQALF